MRILSVFLLAGAVILSATSAQANVVTKDVTFSVTGFTSDYGQPVPIDQLTGSFTVTLDDTAFYNSSTDGITLDSLNMNLGSPISFYYDPGLDLLEVGGESDGAGGVSFITPEDDFAITIANFLGDGGLTPSVNKAFYSEASFTSPALFETATDDLDNTVTVSDPSAVPLPSGLPLLASALAVLGLLGGIAWRGKQRSAADRMAAA